MGMTTQTLLMSNLGALSVASSQPGRLMGHGDSIAHLGQEGDGSMSDFTIEQLEHFKKVMEPTPPFLEALIAEKQAHAELRKRIEERIRELKQPLCSHMPEGDELDDYLEQWGRQSYEAEMLIDILEGDDG